MEPTASVELRWAYYELPSPGHQHDGQRLRHSPTSRDDFFYGLPVVAPTVDAQRAFVAVLGPVWQQQRANAKESRILDALRDALLPKLISGEIRVKDTEESPGRVP